MALWNAPALARKPAVTPADSTTSVDAVMPAFVSYEKARNAYKEALQHVDEDHLQDALRIAEQAYRATPSDAVWWPLVATGLLQRGRAEESLNLFRRYLEALPETERAYFDDLGMVASKEEAQRYASLAGPAKREFLQRFWMQRDPTFVTGGASRTAEHYRRVWFSLTFFSRAATPFDRRGEIYVRYGQPDWRSRWGGPNTLPPPRVQELRDRFVEMFYGDVPKGEDISQKRNFEQYGTIIGPTYPIQSDLTKPGDSYNPMTPYMAGDYTFGFHRYKPVMAGFDVSAVKWEAWVYTRLGDGTEIAFTDELRTGKYDYAPIPTLDKEDFHNPAFGREIKDVMMLFTKYAPENVMKSEIARTPERYDPVIRVEPLNFYYAIADFRGSEADDAFELYAAIPFEQVGVSSGADVQVECRVALLSPDGKRAYRSSGVVSASGEQWKRGGMLLHQTRLEVPPGNYKLAIQSRSPDSDRTTIYSQDVVLEPYGRDTLQISDIQIAHDIRPTTETGKFVKNGLSVTPLPTAAIRPGEKIFVYFEVYNLPKDASGQTRYRVEYAVNAAGRSIATKILSGLGRLVGGEAGPGGAASVIYEQSGKKDWEPNYVEMDLGPTRTGEYIVRVTVSDQLSGRRVYKEAKFKVME